jgi:putative phage-type endonuclease
MKIYKDLQQGTDEWHKLRLGKLGSSCARAVAVNGKGLETKCYQKAAELICGEKEESYTNEHMKRGIRLEGMARSVYEIETGNLVEQVGYIEFSEFVGGSPDGLVGDDGLIEIKCPSNTNYIRNLYKGKIDTKYIWQMQHLMYISGRKWCDFIMFNESLNKIFISRIDRDESKIEKLKIGLEAGEKKIKSILERVKNVK